MAFPLCPGDGFLLGFGGCKNVVGVILDHVAPGGAGHYDMHAFRVAMSFQYVVWAFGIIQILRLRRRTRRLVHASDDYEHLKVSVGGTRSAP